MPNSQKDPNILTFYHVPQLDCVVLTLSRFIGCKEGGQGTSVGCKVNLLQVIITSITMPCYHQLAVIF